MRVAWLLLLLTLLGCAAQHRYARWPYRGPMLEVSNPSRHSVVVSARDAEGRELVTARLRAGRRQCFRWPFIHAIGFLRADSAQSKPFEPWSADGWSWIAGDSLPTANPRVCR